MNTEALRPERSALSLDDTTLLAHMHRTLANA